MSYDIRGGILYHDGEPVFALGQSYYPSYHKQKVPVPEDGDRIGEMKKDMRLMKQAGFNIVRMAALGDVDWNGGDVRVRFDLPDAFCEECEAQDMAAMIRLQGYSMNLRGFENATMIDQNGKSMKDSWDWFVRNCLNHPGILEDNELGTVASAAHFKAFPAVTSFQIYNEPAYPSVGFYDYHPETLKRYALWRRERGLAPCDAPTQRPAAGEDASPWAEWRLFLQERLNDFLCDMADAAKRGYETPATLTCHMGCPLFPGAAIRGEDYYTVAQRMDILGITSYAVNRGPSFHQAAMVLDACESAAATFGKRAWLIEYNARTDMPPQEWPRETYAALARCFKGILYYEWRADYPYPDGPEPEGFGMLYSDGRKASSHDIGVAMNRVVTKLSRRLATADKARDGVAVLYSNRANAWSDATENGAAQTMGECRESALLSMRRCYQSLNERGLTVDFTRACDLECNPLGVRVLTLPFAQGLSEDELDQIEGFQRAGGHVYRWLDTGFEPFARHPKRVLHGVVTDQYDARALMALEKLEPAVSVMFADEKSAPEIDARLLTCEDCLLIVLTNYDPLERPIAGASLRIPGRRFTRATAYATDLAQDGEKLRVIDGRIELPTLAWGAVVVIE